MVTDQATRQTGSSLQDAASGIVDEASQTVEVTASRGMDQAADVIEQVVDAFRGAGSELRSQQPQVAGVIDSALRQVDGASAYLREHEPADVLQRAQSIARQQPALVIGGGLVLGLMLGRVLRTAASPVAPGGSDWNTYRTGRMTAAWPPQRGSQPYDPATGTNGATGHESDGSAVSGSSLGSSSTMVDRS